MSALTHGPTPNLPAIFFEPDNLRGRALASFDAQVPPFGNPTAGVLTPVDYLVGNRISDNFGATLSCRRRPSTSSCRSSSPALA